MVRVRNRQGLEAGCPVIISHDQKHRMVTQRDLANRLHDSCHLVGGTRLFGGVQQNVWPGAECWLDATYKYGAFPKVPPQTTHDCPRGALSCLPFSRRSCCAMHHTASCSTGYQPAHVSHCAGSLVGTVCGNDKHTEIY